MMNKPYNTGQPEWEQILRSLKNGEAVSEDRYNELSNDERLLIAELQQTQQLIKAGNQLDEIDEIKDWLSVKARLDGVAEKGRTISLYSKWLRYAAVIMLPLLIGGIYLLSKSNLKVEEVASIKKEKGTLKKPTLILGDGRSVELDASKSINNSDGAEIFANEANALVYKIAQNPDALPIFNTLVVPKGGEYKLILADGTEVWVNADTRIKYQVNFDASKTREVFLEGGEAFFKVTKNPDKPFIVHNGNMKVQVLGTSFNISAYADNVQTTLTEGKVKLTLANGEAELTLAPDQQANFNRLTGSLEKQDVDVFSFVAWKDGILAFENETMEDLMEQIGRLYDYDIEFKDNSLKQLHYSGSTEKPQDVKKIINIIQKTSNLTLTIKERTIIVERSTKK